MVIEICLLVLMLICSVVDIRTKEIPLWEIAICAVLSTAKVVLDLRGGEADIAGIIFSLLPGAFLLVLSFITKEGIGYGDGLMVLLMGPALGAEGLILGMLIAFFASSFFSAILLIIKKVKRNYRIPFIPFMTIGMGVMILAPI